MSTLTQYGLMAEEHWRRHRPLMVAEMEQAGTLQQMLLEAEEKTKDEMDMVRRQLIQQGLTPQQAHDRAWELVREKYVLLPTQNDYVNLATSPITGSPTVTGWAKDRSNRSSAPTSRR